MEDLWKNARHQAELIAQQDYLTAAKQPDAQHRGLES
jgi:hypothetical protein